MRKVFLSLASVVLTLALFFTACQKETAQETLANNELSTLLETKLSPEEWGPILLPEDLAVDQESLYQYIAGLSEAELRQKIETYRVYDLIRRSNKLSELYKDQPNFEVLTEADLKKYAPETLKYLSAFTSKSRDLVDYNIFPDFPDCDDCFCIPVIDQYCDGTTLVVVEECCNPMCVIEFVSYPNHQLCSEGDPCHGSPDPCCGNFDPCCGVVCGTGLVCENGICVIDEPCNGGCPPEQVCKNDVCVFPCGIPCEPWEHCVKGRCIPW